MQEDTIRRLIDTAFTETRLTTTGGGRVLSPREPLDLFQLLQKAAENEEERDSVDPFTPMETLGGAPFLEFLWDGFGPTSSFASLQLADLGDSGTLVCWFTEVPPTEAFALIQSDDDLEIWSALVAQLFGDNGASYGIGLFGGLPSEVTNHKPDAVPPRVLKDAFWQWLEYMEADGWSVWASLRDQTLGRLEQPDSLQRSTDLLNKLVRLGPEGYLAATKPDPVELPEADRRLILENYFTLSYR
jgi:hypothetical protein